MYRELVDGLSDQPIFLTRYSAIRALTEQLAAPLGPEDQCVQSMPDASPTKWHLAHTTWFFETLVLKPHATGYEPFDAGFAHLFNSYYEALGSRHPRPQRGLADAPDGIGGPCLSAACRRRDRAPVRKPRAGPSARSSKLWRSSGFITSSSIRS